jgi:hypothetical protein
MSPLSLEAEQARNRLQRAARQEYRVWAKVHAPPGLKSDNTERKAKIKATFIGFRRDVSNDVELIESNGEKRTASERSERAFSRRWADEVRRRGWVLGEGKVERVPRAKLPSRAAIKAWGEKNPEAYARYVIDQQELDAYGWALRAAEQPLARPYSGGGFHDGSDGGYARHVGVKQAATLTAQRLRRERIEDDRIFRAEHDGVSEREHDEKQFDAAVAAALLHNVNKVRSQWLKTMVMLVNHGVDGVGWCVETPDNARTLALQAVTKREEIHWIKARNTAAVLDQVFGHVGEATEFALRRVACEDNLKVEFTRSVVTATTRAMKPYLAAYADGRVPSRVLSAPDDFGLRFVRMKDSWFNDVPNGGRPRQHEPAFVRAALARAAQLARWMVTGGAVNGATTSPACPAGVALDLYAVARHQKAHTELTLAQAIGAAYGTRLGTKHALRNVTRQAMASAYDVPVSALTALERALS